MKAKMSEEGVITISPQDSVEAFALKNWVKQAEDVENNSFKSKYLEVVTCASRKAGFNHNTED